MGFPADQIAFGPFCLDMAVPRLTRDGVDLDLRPQALHALYTLLQNRGRCVDYDEMIRHAWHGTSVSRHTVAVTVGEVKKALREYGSWIDYRPKLGYQLEAPQSTDLIRSGWHFWQRHTREGFEKALIFFQKAAQDNSADFRAYEGLSRCWLMLGTFGMRRPSEAHARFLDAHKRAVSFCGRTPELRADRAQAYHVFERRFADAETELFAANRERPNVMAVHVRLAMVYATWRRYREALEVLEKAYAADGFFPIVPCVEVFIHSCRHDFKAAVDAGRKAIDLHPWFAFARSYYGEALELAERYNEALEQHRLAHVLAPDLPRLRAMEARCLAKIGRRQDAEQILAELERARRKDYVDAYHVAGLQEALGHREKALQELERAFTETSSALFTLDVDPMLDALRGHPRFAHLVSRVFDTAPTEALAAGMAIPA